MLTPSQRRRLTDLILTELRRHTAVVLAAGADRAAVDAELRRRIEAIENKAGRPRPTTPP